MTALTPENARPGLRVKCVEADNWGLSVGGEYVLSREPGRSYVSVEGNDWVHAYRRFILAEPTRPTLRAILAEHDPEFLAAAVDWAQAMRAWTDAGLIATVDKTYVLLDAIERANLHAPAEVQPPAPLPAMYLGEDAFDDAR